VVQAPSKLSPHQSRDTVSPTLPALSPRYGSGRGSGRGDRTAGNRDNPSATATHINRKTFCATFSNHFVSFLELLTQNELRKFIRFSGLFKQLSKTIKKHLKSYILPIFV
jgi:hypothetical protein